MAERSRRNRRQGGPLGRTETVTMRFDPKTRYLMDLAARKQRRTVSSFIDAAVAKELGNIELGTREEQYTEDMFSPSSQGVGSMMAPVRRTRTVKVMLMDEAERLWDPYEADRFVTLAIRHPSLMNHEESLLWKLISECPAVWLSKDEIDFPKLREHWDAFKQVASGEAGPDILPTREDLGRPSV